MAPKVFASCSAYVTGRIVGQKSATTLVTELVKRGEPSALPDWMLPSLAGAMTLHRVAKLFDTTLRVDGGGTRIGVTRSRHFHDAQQSACDVWLTVDDDVEASERTLRWLIEAVTSDEPRVAIAPCLFRESGVVNVEWHPLFMTRRLSDGGMVRRCKRGGFGLVAVNRAAMNVIALRAVQFRDADGVKKPAPFIEDYDGVAEQWHGEDLSFFRRLPENVIVEALVTGETGHGAAELNLERLQA